MDNYYVKLKNQKNSDVINDTLKYYVNQAVLYKHLFYFISIASIVFNVMIPIFNQFIGDFKLIISIISGIAAIFTGILSIVGVRDNWFRYRTHAEMLKSECNKFNAKIGEYENDSTCEEVFIMNFERINSEEKALWSESLNDN